jgi:DNA mismatch repair ATPase MutS
LELDLRERYGDRISLKHLLGQGFVVHLSDFRESTKSLSSIEDEMSLAYKSKTTRTYYHEAFTKIGSRLLRVERELNEKEAVELQRLRLDVLVELGKLRKNSALVNEMDVLLGFAKLAKDMNFCRPIVNEGDDIDIKGGRHLSVEMALLHQSGMTAAVTNSRPFTPNDLHLHPDSRLHLITGPNMGGKSTLLRMISIITILAQIGSFVPATSCTIGIVDQIFSRIGAHDSINTEKSTFMVEMLEVAEFLKRSSRKSLIICDEIGRGTDHKTGIAIAFATALHLLDEVQCKCLFATHLYHVGDLLKGRQGVDFFCTDLYESEGGQILFSHRLRPGLNRNSHGLSIARLAGVPDNVLQTAKMTLQGLQSDAIE